MVYGKIVLVSQKKYALSLFKMAANLTEYPRIEQTSVIKYLKLQWYHEANKEVREVHTFSKDNIPKVIVSEQL